MKINREKRKSEPKVLFFVILVIIFSGFVFTQVAFAQAKITKNLKHGCDVAAYIWPSCHNDPRAERLLWPEGVGEWQIIKKGLPGFQVIINQKFHYGFMKWMMIQKLWKNGFRPLLIMM